MTIKYVWNGFAQNDTGDVLGGATVTVRDQDTNALSTLYTDKDGGTESSNPFLVGDSGQIAFYASSGRYKITAVKDSDTVTFENVVIGVPDDALQAVDTLAELIDWGDDASVGDSVYCNGRSNSGDGYQGHFFKVSTDYSYLASVDSKKGICFETSDGNYVVRSYGQNVVANNTRPEINVLWFDVNPDGVENNTSGIQAAVAVMESVSKTGFGPGTDGEGGGVLYFPACEGTGYVLKDPLIIQDDSYVFKGDGSRKTNISLDDGGQIIIGTYDTTVDVWLDHGVYDGIIGPSRVHFRDMRFRNNNDPNPRASIVAAVANRIYFDNVEFSNTGDARNHGLELISAQWVYLNNCIFNGHAQAGLFINAAGAGHGHVHVNQCTFSISGGDLDGTTQVGRAHILAHSYRGDGTEGSPSVGGGNFFGNHREISINSCFFYQATADQYTPFAAIKSRNYLWPNESNPGTRDETVSVFANLCISGATWFEGIHTWGDFNGQDTVNVLNFESLANGRTVQGFKMGDGNDSNINVLSGTVNEFIADSKMSFTSISGGTISSGDYFQDGSGNINRVRGMNDSGDEAYCRVEAPSDIIDIAGGGQAVTFYSDAAATTPTGVTATATLEETCAAISTNDKFFWGEVDIEGPNVTRFNIIDFVRADINVGSASRASYGAGVLGLTYAETLSLSAANTDFTYPVTWPHQANPREVTCYPRGTLDAGWYINSINSSRVRVTRGGATAGDFFVKAKVFESR